MWLLPMQFDLVHRDTAEDPLVNTVSVSDSNTKLSGTETDTETGSDPGDLWYSR